MVRARANWTFQEMRRIDQQLHSAPQGFLSRNDLPAQALRMAILSVSATTVGSFASIIGWLSASATIHSISSQNLGRFSHEGEPSKTLARGYSASDIVLRRRLNTQSIGQSESHFSRVDIKQEESERDSAADLDSKVRREANLGFQQLISIEQQLRTAPEGFLDRVDMPDAEALRTNIVNLSISILRTFSEIIGWLSAGHPNSTSDHKDNVGQSKDSNSNLLIARISEEFNSTSHSYEWGGTEISELDSDGDACAAATVIVTGANPDDVVKECNLSVTRWKLGPECLFEKLDQRSEITMTGLLNSSMGNFDEGPDLLRRGSEAEAFAHQTKLYWSQSLNRSKSLGKIQPALQLGMRRASVSSSPVAPGDFCSRSCSREFIPSSKFGSTPDQIKRLGHDAYVDDLIREVEGRNGDGCFLSFVWLASLEENKRESLISVLLRCGYSQTYHTSTTTLWERLGDEGQNRTIGKEVSSIVTTNDICAKDERDEDSQGILRISDGGLSFDNRPGIVPSDDFRKPPIIGDVLDSGSNIFEDVIATSHSLTSVVSLNTKVLPAQQQATSLKSFIAALRGKTHQSYFVSTEWLSRLENHGRRELETVLLECGYAKVHQTSHTTSFERICDSASHPISFTVENQPSSTHDKTDVAVSDTKRRGGSQSGDSLPNKKLKGNVNNDENTSGSSELTTTNKTGPIQDGNSTCHPQILKVSFSISPSSLLASLSSFPSTSSSQDDILTPHFRKHRLGDTVATIPRKKESRTLSTTIDRHFVIKTVKVSPDTSHCEAADVTLKGSVTTTLGCCLRVDGNRKTIRIKFSKISGEVENEESMGQRCNALVLSSLQANIYACIKSTEGDSEDESEEIILNLEDEYNHPPRRRLLDNDLVWLAKADIKPVDSDPGSLTLELRGDITGRCKADLSAKSAAVADGVCGSLQDDCDGEEGDLEIALRGAGKNHWMRVGANASYEVFHLSWCRISSTQNAILEGSFLGAITVS
ncbi:unnamed protein product [Calypogeia fissa]